MKSMKGILGWIMSLCHYLSTFIFDWGCFWLRFLLTFSHTASLLMSHAFLFTANDQQTLKLDGLDYKQYNFQTADGEKLLMWRIRANEPQKNDFQDMEENNNEKKNSFPILLQHGLLDSGMSWFMQQKKEKCLPFILAQQGYDVWVGNNRGNRHSPANRDYCFDQLVLYDQPAFIEGILHITKKSKLIYIGHSQGSTQFLAALKQHPHLLNKIACFIGLGTVVFMENLHHPLLNYIAMFNLIEIIKFLGFRSFLVLSNGVRRVAATVLCMSSVAKHGMMSIINALCGTSAQNNIPMDFLPVIIAHEPGGASVRNVMQWIQCFRRGRLSKYDYGSEINLHFYGSLLPPLYCMSHLKSLPFKSMLVHGCKDAVMSPKNFGNFIKQFRSDSLRLLSLDDYHHLDYLWSKTAEEDLYHKVLEFIQI